MTTNQIAYHNLLESQRSNKARESENYRSNLAKEAENYRSNTAKEQENIRSNKADESIRRRSNKIKSQELDESKRHNKVQEGIGISDSVSKHTSAIGSVIKGIGSLLS